MSGIKVGIFGYGAFGQLMADILKTNFDVYVTNRSDKSHIAKEKGLKYLERQELLNTCEVIFLCVPISLVESTLKEFKFSPTSIVIDTCSVKEYPVELMKKNLPEETRIIASHPMFGPNTISSKLEGLNVVFSNIRCDEAHYKVWTQYFSSLNMNVIEMTPEEHDKSAAYTQILTHLVSHIYDDMNIANTKIDTISFKDTFKVFKAINNNSPQLFADMLKYNKYSKKMIKDFNKSLGNITKN